MRITKSYDERFEEFIRITREMFIEKGIHDTSVNDIIAKMDVAKGTFYYYFKSKEQLIEVILKRELDGLLTELTRIAKDSRKTFCFRLKELLTELCCHNAHYNLLNDLPKPQYRQLYDSISSSFIVRFSELLSALLDEGLTDGFIHAKHTQELSYLAVSGVSTIKYLAGVDARIRMNSNDMDSLLQIFEEMFHMVPGILVNA